MSPEYQTQQYINGWKPLAGHANTWRFSEFSPVNILVWIIFQNVNEKSVTMQLKMHNDIYKFHALYM